MHPPGWYSRRTRLIAALLIIALILLAQVITRAFPRAEEGTPTPHGVRVSGRWLVDSTGQPILLRGVNRSGTEYACVQGKGIFDGPTDDPSIAAIVAWRANVVRLPLNENCWLGINGVPEDSGGATYQAAIRDYVDRLDKAGLLVILDLHWTAPGDESARVQQPMPDRDHAIAFWQQVASAFKDNGRILFDLFNEPILESGEDESGWRCWRDGGTCAGLGYKAAGMQELVNAVRSTGANNIILLGGLSHANDLRRWLAYKPNDPAHNLVASWHVYDFNDCSTVECFDAQIAPLTRRVPLIASEIGQRGCVHDFLDVMLNRLDVAAAGYLGWTWNPWDCSDGPALITDFYGTPTAYGQGLKDHLASVTSTPATSDRRIAPVAGMAAPQAHSRVDTPSTGALGHAVVSEPARRQAAPRRLLLRGAVIGQAAPPDTSRAAHTRAPRQWRSAWRTTLPPGTRTASDRRGQSA